MPSNYSVNKPSNTLRNSGHARHLAKKRANRVVVPVVGPNDTKSLAFYTGPPAPGPAVTTNTLSRKRQKKLERNSRYIARRKELLKATLAAENGDMELDATPSQRKERNKKPQTTLDKVKEALWTVVDDHTSGAITIESSGEGTTLGTQAF